MQRMVWYLCLILLAAAGLGSLSGCFGVSHNPSYFPHFFPFGDVIRTHAKPGGGSYFSDFDPHAVRLEVQPIDAVNPVRTQHVFIATIYDEEGKPRRNRRVEWMLEGVGNIVEVDESGFFPGRGYKVDNKYAVSYTDYTEHHVSRGNGNPNDDFEIRPGQTWCVITSAMEGDTHVTVYAPEIANWDHHKVFVTKHWIDAGWVFPKPAINRAGTDHVFTTHIFRHSDHQPLANYRVRYRILSGPPALFLPSRSQEAVAISDLNGDASVTLVQAAAQPGINRIGIEIIRAPDPTATSGVGMVIGRDETTKEWQAPGVALTKTGPATAPLGQEIPYTLTVANTGQIETRSLTVRDLIPESLQFVRSQPPAVVEGNQLIWTLGELPGRQSRTIEVVFKSTRIGIVTNRAGVVTDEGLKDEKAVTTEITAPATPQLKVAKTGPSTGVVGVPITYRITVTNPGTGPATNILVKDDFDAGLEHETRANPIEVTLGTLAPGESKDLPVILTPRKSGTLVNRVVVTADGNLSDRAEHPITVQEPKLALTKTGPAWRYSERPAPWNIQVTNAGDVPLNNVVVRDLLPPELGFTSATENGQFDSGQIVWNIGPLQPGEQKIVQVTTKCLKLTERAVNVATATADGGIQARAQAPIEIRGLPAFRLEVVDIGDPVEVNGMVTYKIDVTNQGTLRGTKVKIVAEVPPEMRVTDVKGPTRYQIDGQRVTFDPVDALEPKQALNYTIQVQALKPGDVRFRVWLTSDTLSQPVLEEESTNIVAPGSGQRPAPPAGPPPLAPPGPMTEVPTGVVPAGLRSSEPGGRVPIATSEPPTGPITPP